MSVVTCGNDYDTVVLGVVKVEGGELGETFSAN
jgi:hypothetical protein